MDPPPAEALIIALEQLYALGALNHLGELTKVNNYTRLINERSIREVCGVSTRGQILRFKVFIM